MIFCYLCVDVSPSHMFVILLWFSISLLGVMFYHLSFDVLSSLPLYFTIFCRCFVITYVCYPTFIFDIIVRCNVFSSSLLMYHHLCHVILPSFSRCFAIAYSFSDASPLHILLADVSPSHMFVILLWFSISLLGVIFYHLSFDILSSFPWYFAIFLPMFRHCICFLSYFDFQYYC